MIEHISEWDVRGREEDAEPWFTSTGYYFADETGEWNGPYGTYMEAELAETVYNKSLG